MIEVGFTNCGIEGIQEFHKYPFAEAYALTQGYNAQPKNKGKHTGFALVQENQTLYRGTFTCGREGVENIYQHVLKHLHSLDLTGEERENRERLIRDMYQAIPEEARRAEDKKEEREAEELEANATTNENSKAWYLIPKYIYASTGSLVVVLMVALFVVQNHKGAQVEALAQMIEEEQTTTGVLDEAAYQDLLLNNGSATLEAMEQTSEEERNQMTDDEKEIVARLYVDQEQYEAAAMFLANERVASLVSEKGIEPLKAFHAERPTETGSIVIAKNHLKNDDLAAAKEEAEGVENEGLQSALSSFESLQNDISALNETIRDEDDKDDDDKDDDKIKEWRSERDGKEEELDALKKEL